VRVPSFGRSATGPAQDLADDLGDTHSPEPPRRPGGRRGMSARPRPRGDDGRGVVSKARPQRRGLALDPWWRACSGVRPCQGPPLAAASRRRDAPSL